MEISLIYQGHPLWESAKEFARSCSWKAGRTLARLMEENAFLDWERVIVAAEGDCIAGYCTFMKKDELPDEYPYTPFIGFLFVSEQFRGKRLSGHMISRALKYAASLGYETVYLMSGERGLYEKYGFEKLGELPTIYGSVDQLFQIKLTGSAIMRAKGDTMDVFDAILQRGSYRGKYSPTPVPRADLIKIMQAGLAAPSGCNKQTTSLIAVDDPAVLKQLTGAIDPPVGETAPAAICVLTRRINAYRDKCFAVQDYSAAIENMLLAITALGYRSCWYEGHITDDDRLCDKMARILNVPPQYDLVCFLPIGIAQGDAVPPRKKPFEERAWFNSFPQTE